MDNDIAPSRAINKRKLKRASKFGLIASLYILISSSLPMLLYPGYSILNYAISELGWQNSPLKFVFNSGLVVTGILMVGFFFEIGRIFGPISILERENVTMGLKFFKLTTILGIISSVSMCFIGGFPGDVANQMHVISAIGFFAGMALAIIFFGITLLMKDESIGKVFPPQMIFLTLFTFVCVSIFIFHFASASEVPGTMVAIDRPDFWPFLFWEWMFFYSVVLWGLTISIIGFVKSRSSHV